MSVCLTESSDEGVLDVVVQILWIACDDGGVCLVSLVSVSRRNIYAS